MGVRPPSTDDEEEPEVIAFGIATIDARLQGSELTFPATAEDVIEELGGPEVPYDVSGRSMSLEVAVEETGKRRFENRQELLNALHPIFEARREQSGGVVDRVRSLLPF